MELRHDEQLLILAIREFNLHPINVMVSLKNSFVKDNRNGEWDSQIEILDKYIEPLSE